MRLIATRDVLCSKNDVSELNEKIVFDIVEVMNSLSSQLPYHDPPRPPHIRDIVDIVHSGTQYNGVGRSVWGYLDTPRFYHVGGVAAVVFAIPLQERRLLELHRSEERNVLLQFACDPFCMSLSDGALVRSTSSVTLAGCCIIDIDE